MAKVKAGFENGNVVVCIDASGRSFLTEGKEYEVMSYWDMDRRYKNADERFPALIICDQSFNSLGISFRQVVHCRYFMPKSDYLIKTRNSKIDSVFGYE